MKFLGNLPLAIVQEPRQHGWGTETFVADPDGYMWALVRLAKQ
jgi:hypothetical protein